MADFCEKCATEMGFKADFNIKEDMENLSIGYIKAPYLCEGCGLKAIQKTNEGIEQYLYFDNENWEDKRR